MIGNHGYRHVQMTEEGAEKVRESVEKTGKIIEEIIGEEPEYLRPPYGDWNEELAEKMDLTPVFWSVDSLDWKYQNTPKMGIRDSNWGVKNKQKMLDYQKEIGEIQQIIRSA